MLLAILFISVVVTGCGDKFAKDKEEILKAEKAALKEQKKAEKAALKEQKKAEKAAKKEAKRREKEAKKLAESQAQ